MKLDSVSTVNNPTSSTVWLAVLRHRHRRSELDVCTATQSLQHRRWKALKRSLLAPASAVQATTQPVARQHDTALQRPQPLSIDIATAHGSQSSHVPLTASPTSPILAALEQAVTMTPAASVSATAAGHGMVVISAGGSSPVVESLYMPGTTSESSLASSDSLRSNQNTSHAVNSSSPSNVLNQPLPDHTPHRPRNYNKFILLKSAHRQKQQGASGSRTQAKPALPKNLNRNNLTTTGGANGTRQDALHMPLPTNAVPEFSSSVSLPPSLSASHRSHSAALHSRTADGFAAAAPASAASSSHTSQAHKHTSQAVLPGLARPAIRTELPAHLVTQLDTSAGRLMVTISSATSFDDLQKIYHSSSRDMLPEHFAAWLFRLQHLQHKGSASSKDHRWLVSNLMEIATLLKQHVPSMNARALCTAAFALAKLELKSKELMLLFVKHSEPMLSTLPPINLFNLIWAFAKLGFSPPISWVDRFVDCSLKQLGGFQARELSMVMWSLGKLQYKLAPAKLVTVVTHIQQNMASFSCRELSSILYSLVTTHTAPSREFIEATCSRVLEQPAAQLTPHSLTSFYWSVCKLSEGAAPSEALTLRLSQYYLTCRTTSSKRPQHNFSHQDVATLLYSFAVCGHNLSPNLALKLYVHLMEGIDGLDSRQLANVTWAAGRLHLLSNLTPAQASKLSNALVSYSFRRLHLFRPADLSQCIWGLASLNVRVPDDWINTFMDRLHAVGSEMAPKEVSSVVWALAKIELSVPPFLLAELCAATHLQLSSFQPWELSQIVWALGKTHSNPGREFLHELLKASYHKMSAFQPQGLANLLWGLQQLGTPPPVAWLYQYIRAGSEKLQQFNVLDLGQVIPALKAFTVNSPSDKVESFLTDAVTRMAELEASSQAYSKSQLHYFMSWRAKEARSTQAVAVAMTASGSDGNTHAGTSTLTQSQHVSRSSSSVSSTGSISSVVTSAANGAPSSHTVGNSLDNHTPLPPYQAKATDFSGSSITGQSDACACAGGLPSNCGHAVSENPNLPTASISHSNGLHPQVTAHCTLPAPDTLPDAQPAKVSNGLVAQPEQAAVPCRSVNGSTSHPDLNSSNYQPPLHTSGTGYTGGLDSVPTLKSLILEMQYPTSGSSSHGSFIEPGSSKQTSHTKAVRRHSRKPRQSRELLKQVAVPL